jgi:hypothetical protein
MMVVALLAYACGPRSGTPVASSRPAAGRPAARLDRGVTSSVMVDTSRGEVRFVIAVENGSRKQVELDFPNGRTHDFVVYREDGTEVWRWSNGRLFTQGMQNRLLEARDSVMYTERWRPVAKGRYTLVAQLLSENYPVSQRVAFALE